jgi:ribonuclease T
LFCGIVNKWKALGGWPLSGELTSDKEEDENQSHSDTPSHKD